MNMNDKKSWLLLLVIVAVVVIAGFLFFTNQNDGAPAGEDVANSADSDYQAVFLINNQVYFGKLANANRQYVSLTDIYYLQVNQPIQPLAEGQNPGPDINLVKLGGELHGPTDEMRINRDHILLVEDLRADSNLVNAIEQFKSRQEQNQ